MRTYTRIYSSPHPRRYSTSPSLLASPNPIVHCRAFFRFSYPDSVSCHLLRYSFWCYQCQPRDIGRNYPKISGANDTSSVGLYAWCKCICIAGENGGGCAGSCRYTRIHSSPVLIYAHVPNLSSPRLRFSIVELFGAHPVPCLLARKLV